MIGRRGRRASEEVWVKHESEGLNVGGAGEDQPEKDGGHGTDD